MSPADDIADRACAICRSGAYAGHWPSEGRAEREVQAR